MNPRSCLRWKPTGRIFSNVRLRWVPTGRLFNSCTSKVESEPTHDSNVDIYHIHACKQTLGLSADQASVFMEMMSVHISSGLVLHQMTSDHNRSELRIQDHSNEPSSSKLVPKVVPLAVKTATSTTRMGIMLTKIESTLEQSQNGVNNDILLPGKSNRLYRLRIRPPLLGSAISRSRILEIAKLYIDEDSISFRLVKDFLYNHYQNEEGERCILNYIPDFGEITDALEDLIMTSMFENAFRKKFPNICCYRFLNEVLINCTCEEDEITFNESAGYALLKEIKLPGDIVSIGPGVRSMEGSQFSKLSQHWAT
ncbi:hypothetical protein Tco_0811939 [Tanacetum coccineum]